MAYSSSGSNRLLSIDALRGFDMLMISGAGSFIGALALKTNWPWAQVVAAQFEHPAWHGFTFYDFIMPLFLFIAGVSLPFSLNKGLKKGLSKKQLYRKAFRRMFILIILGIFYKNAPVPFFDPTEIRFGSVLGRIGFAGFITTLFFLNFNWWQRLIAVFSILLVYYAAVFYIPVPGFGAGDLSFEGNLVGWFDRKFNPGRLLQGTYDELGLLTQFPALCLTMLGAMGGELLRNRELSQGEKLQYLSIAGTVGIGLGILWSLHFPINKHLWSSSFILLTAGMAFWSLFIFYGVIDVWGKRKWAYFFKVIGMNSLVIYLVYRFINFPELFRLIFSGLYAPIREDWHSVIEAAGGLLLVWLLLHFLYKKKIFIKV